MRLVSEDDIGDVKNQTQEIGPRITARWIPCGSYEPVDTEEGYVYELSRGIITVSNVPAFPHAWLKSHICGPTGLHRVAHPEEIYIILGSFDSKVLIGEFESERHPDRRVQEQTTPERGSLVALYPDVVVEIVSHSKKRLRRNNAKSIWPSASRNTGSSMVANRKSWLCAAFAAWSEQLVTAEESYQSGVAGIHSGLS